MNAREEILHLINRYTFTIDTGDLEGFASLFEYGEWIMKDAEPIVADNRSGKQSREYAFMQTAPHGQNMSLQI